LNDTLSIVEARIASANCPEDLFGVNPDGVKSAYHQIARTVHPDLHPGESDRASRIFGDVGEWYALAVRRIERGTYGDRAPKTPAFDPVPITIGKTTYTLTAKMGDDIFTTIYEAGTKVVGGQTRRLLARVVRAPSDAGRLDREARALLGLAQKDPEPEREAFFHVQRAYVPAYDGGFQLRGAGSTRYRGALLSIPEGRAFTLQELREKKFPAGIEPKHVWWIYRRLLLTLWMGHLHGYVHGAVTPDHVLVYPKEHGLVLLDWTCYAEYKKERITAIDPRWSEFIPPEVFDKKNPTPATDLFMATATAFYALGGDPTTCAVPGPPLHADILRDLRQALDPNPSKRPQDAEKFHNRFGETLERAFGSRQFAEFVVP
jgi:hypothetical protein